ncbi:MAG: PTS sugar transporter subunit IIA [Erysipelotrichaceae bacterium]|nr:PTS sugar transporter subunit IIA [Erysipelotrichaceae bacterium]
MTIYTESRIKAMDDKYLLLLELFNNLRDKTINAKEIASKMGYSTRTILRYINIINSLDDNQSFRIISIKNKGFKLQILDEKEYESFYNKAIARKLLSEDNNELLFRLVLDDLSANYLEKELNYSQPSITRLISSLNEKLSNRRLSILRKNNYYSLFGNEIQIRNFGQYLWQLSNFAIDKLPEKYRDEYLKYSNYLKGNDITDLPDLQSFLFISLIRINNGHNISFSPVLKEIFDKNGINRKMVEPIGRYFMDNCRELLNEDELTFASLMLSNECGYAFNESVNAIMPVVTRLLLDIDGKYGTSFANDNELLNAFCSHIASNMTSYILMNKTDNSLLNQIRLNFTNEHVYALELANGLNELLDVVISDEDIGYLTLHFANCNAKNKQDAEVDATVVYTQSLAAANLLSVKLKDLFPQLNIKIKHKDEIGKDDEFVIAFEEDEDIDCFLKVSLFLKEEEKTMIEAAIRERVGFKPFMALCDKRNFFVIEKVKSKNDFLLWATSDLIKRGYLTNDEALKILERENLSSTEIAMGVAFPHGIVSSKSFLAIYIFKQPVYWQSNHVRMALLMGYSNKESNGNSNAIKYIFSNISDQVKVEKLVATTTFDDFIRILRSNGYVKQ